MTPDELLRAMGEIIEECAHGKRDRVTGEMEKLKRAEWLEIRLRFETLVVLNMPRLGTETDDDAG